MIEWKRIIVPTPLASNPIACIRNWSILTKNLPRTWVKINWKQPSSCYWSRGFIVVFGTAVPLDEFNDDDNLCACTESAVAT